MPPILVNVLLLVSAVVWSRASMVGWVSYGALEGEEYRNVKRGRRTSSGQVRTNIIGPFQLERHFTVTGIIVLDPVDYRHSGQILDKYYRCCVHFFHWMAYNCREH